ncbi:MAG: hypothetical protein GXP29_04675 [Planctomycetes bacterium]|nr:hypothetical protein [Planctomycetota bacterium]
MRLDKEQIEVMADVLRKKSGVERLAIAWRMWSSTREMLGTHLRNEHPEWGAERIQQEVSRRMSHGTV